MIEALHAIGIWVFPCTVKPRDDGGSDKAPLRGHLWKDQRYDPAAGLAGCSHWAWRPSTGDWLILDNDHGNAHTLVANWPKNSYRVVPSGKQGRAHIIVAWRRAWGDVGNSKWRRAGCSGEIRHAEGWCVAWDVAALHDAIIVNPPIPHDEIKRIVEGAVSMAAEKSADDWSEGNRNDTLFRHVVKDPDNAESYADKARAAGLPNAEVKATVASALKRAEERRTALQGIVRDTSWPTPDFANATSLASQCPLHVRFDDDCQEWHLFEAATGWRKCRKRELHGLLNDWLYRLGSAVAETDKELRDILRASDRVGVVRIAEALSCASRVLTDQASIDPDPHMLGLPDGTSVNLLTGEVTATDPSGPLMKAAAAVPDGTTPPSEFLSAFERIVPRHEVREWIRAYFKLSLSGIADYQCALLLTGVPGAGKSLLAHALKVIAGEHYATCTGSRFDKMNNAHEAWKVALLSSRVVVVDEVDGREWHPDIKAMISGEATDCGRKGQDPVMRVPRCHITMTANNPPPASSRDGMARRLYVVRFDQTIAKPDRRLFAKIADEAPQILAWVLAADLHAVAEPPAALVGDTKRFVDDSDAALPF